MKKIVVLFTVLMVLTSGMLFAGGEKGSRSRKERCGRRENSPDTSRTHK